MSPKLPWLLREHETSGGGRWVPSAISRDRLHTLEFSNAKLIRSIHTGGVAALDLDPVEQRYLLAGAGDASIAVYDTQQVSPEAEAAAQSAARDAAGAEAALAGGARVLRPSAQAGVAAANAEHTEHAALLSIGKAAPGAHRFSVSAVAWYPVDTGLFVSGGFDSEVKVWDTNSQCVVVSFSLAARVYTAAMSATAASHCLVAVGSGDTQVMLCDVVSGGFTHTLSGHRAAVWAVAWSPASEWQLVTGGCDGQLRLWDIRRSGPLHVFNEHDTRQQRLQQRQQEAQAARQQPEAPQRRPAAKGQRRQDVQQPPAAGVARQADGNGSRQRRLQRSGSGGAGGGAAAAPAARAVGGSDRMFLPERVSKYSTAHAGSITGVVPTPNGLHWLSAGTDDRVRLWDAATHRHELVHFAGAYNRASRARQLAVSDDSSTLFHPSGSVVQMYDVTSGQLVCTLGGGHFDTINCCKWNPAAQELYSGSDDCNIVVWAPAPELTRAERDEGEPPDSDGDAWSD